MNVGKTVQIPIIAFQVIILVSGVPVETVSDTWRRMVFVPVDGKILTMSVIICCSLFL